MKNFIIKNWRIWFLSYVVIYLPWFFTLEKLITQESSNIHIIHCFLDDFIPFNEYFIIPYIIWFFYVALACIYMFFKGTDSEYFKFAMSLVIGMSISLLICMIYPNGLNLRPAEFPRDNVFSRFVAGLYSTDTSTNVFPSIHVYNSLAVHIALVKCTHFKKHTWLKLISLIICISICASTVFLKQHSVIDVLGGGILMSVMYILLYVVDFKQVFAKIKKKENTELLENQ